MVQSRFLGVQSAWFSPLSMKVEERFRLLGRFLWMKDERLPKIVLIGQPFRATRKANRPRLDWEDVIMKNLK